MNKWTKIFQENLIITLEVLKRIPLIIFLAFLVISQEMYPAAKKHSCVYFFHQHFYWRFNNA